MWLYDLGIACRKSGLPVEEMAGWQERGHGGMADAVRTVTLHHTAGPATGEAPSLNTVMFGRPGLEGPLSHLVLGRSGTVYVVAAGLCWHAGAVWTTEMDNAHSIGIEAEATGVDPWPRAQYDAYVRLARALADHYRLPYSSIRGHKEVCRPAGRKIDPNFDCPAFRTAVAYSQEVPDVDANQDKMLREIHRESTQRLGRRIDGSTYNDTVMGFAMNADSFGYRAAEALARIETGQAEIKDRLAALEGGNV